MVLSPVLLIGNSIYRLLFYGYVYPLTFATLQMQRLYWEAIQSRLLFSVICIGLNDTAVSKLLVGL